jgi:endonuclease/exonuclease/phosphatase (EEP) superfamily protein YafD
MNKKLPRLCRAIQILCWLNLAGLLLLWLFLHVAGDRWWLATLILFGPRWIWALPLGVLIPAAALFRRRSLWVLGTAAIVVVGPIMGLCLGGGESATPNAVLRLRVLTCNTQGEQLDNDALTRLISATQPDIVALQEWRPPRPPAVFADEQWHILRFEDFVVGSRFPIEILHVASPQHEAQHHGAAVACEVQTPGQSLRFFCVHLTSPHGVFRNALHLHRHGWAQVQYNIMLRREEAEDLDEQAAQADGPVLLAGDFNLPSDSTIYRQNFASFTDAFADAGVGFGWTYYEKWTVTRIDHILCGPGWRCSRCWIGPDVGSDHRPLLAELHWTPPAGRWNGGG